MICLCIIHIYRMQSRGNKCIGKNKKPIEFWIVFPVNDRWTIWVSSFVFYRNGDDEWFRYWWAKESYFRSGIKMTIVISVLDCLILKLNDLQAIISTDLIRIFFFYYIISITCFSLILILRKGNINWS